MAEELGDTKLGFNDLLLGGIILIMGVGITMGIGLYVLPTDPLQIPEMQPAARVMRVADFPVGASRVINWGERIILVVRSPDQGFVALQGTSPTDGCILRWDPESLRVVSPCAHLIYDLFGNVVTGLSTAPLQRYEVFVRGEFVYVTEA
jgi:nitrite reductase/ring-hydroxylating ferredoxin subunit